MTTESALPPSPPQPAPSDRPPAPGPVRPDARFLWSHPAHSLALGLGSGLSPVAPGTVGTLWGWLVFAAASSWWQGGAGPWILLGSLLVGWWACTLTATHARTADPGFIVWDEIVAIWLVLWLLTPASWWLQLLAFALFRYFDATKPGPVRWADQRFKGGGWRGGFGILFDDLVAAGCTLLVLALLLKLWPGLR